MLGKPLLNFAMSCKIFVTLVLCVCCFIKLPSQNLQMIYYSEDCNYDGVKILVSEMAKSRRLAKTGGGGTIKVVYGTSMPDSLKVAVDVASSVWKDYMNVGDMLVLQIKYGETTSDNDIKTGVLYGSMDGKLYYPVSLYRKLSPAQVIRSDGYDAVIEINNQVKWCVGLGEENAQNPKKLSFALLREIGRCLGYGSSVKKDSRGNVRFEFTNGMSVFDKSVLAEDGSRMESLSNRDVQKFKNFVQQECGYLYVGDKMDSRKIYAPIQFDELKSLKYSINPQSIMYYGDLGEMDLCVDDVTIEVLSSMGWNFEKKKDAVWIIGDNMNADGIASAYQEHKFQVQTTEGVLSNHEWTFELTLKNGDKTIVETSQEEEFIIPAIVNEEDYEHTLEGDIKGLITYRGLLNGVMVSCQYSVTLELKPHILKVEIISLTPTTYDPSYYDALIDIYYEGTHYVHISTEEELTPLSKTYFSDIPYYTRVKLTDLDSWGYVRVNVKVLNDYGSSNYVMEIPADVEYYMEQISNMPHTPINKENGYVEVYGIDGVYQGRFSNVEDIPYYGKLLLVKEYKDNQYIRTIKLIRK